MDYTAGPLDTAQTATPLLVLLMSNPHLLRLFIRVLLGFIPLRISICHSRPLPTHPFRNKFIVERLYKDAEGCMSPKIINVLLLFSAMKSKLVPFLGMLQVPCIILRSLAETPYRWNIRPYCTQDLTSYILQAHNEGQNKSGTPH